MTKTTITLPRWLWWLFPSVRRARKEAKIRAAAAARIRRKRMTLEEQILAINPYEYPATAWMLTNQITNQRKETHVGPTGRTSDPS